MVPIKMVPPPIPKEFRKISNLYVVGRVCHASVQFFGGAWITLTLFEMVQLGAWSSVSSLVMGLAWLVGLLLSSNGLYNFSALAHEGGHGNLNRNLLYSYILGVVGSSFVPFFTGATYMISHWPHHRFTNTEMDPPSAWAKKSKVDSRPKIIGFLYTGLAAFIPRSVMFFLSPNSATKLKLRASEVKAIVSIGYVSALISLVAWSLVLYFNPIFFLFALALPYVGFLMLVGVYTYFEHGDTALGYQFSWSHTHPIFTLLNYGDNYHLEHHLYPRVQSSKLPLVHKHLLESGYFAKNNCKVENNFFSSIKLVFTSKILTFKSEFDVTAAEIEDEDSKFQPISKSASA